jgi:hypothetical protein
VSPKRRKPPSDDPLDAYRRVRKPVPPPARVIPDRRDKLAERADRRERRGEKEP